jgi:hypothetical protein
MGKENKGLKIVLLDEMKKSISHKGANAQWSTMKLMIKITWCCLVL